MSGSYRRLAVLVFASLGVCIAAASSIAGAQTPIVFEFPTDGPRSDLSASADNVSDALGMETTYRLGTTETYDGDLEPRPEGIRVSWRAETDGSSSAGHSFHQPTAGTDESGNYLVSPTNLTHGIEFWTGGAFLQVTASPGQLPGNASADATERAIELAQRLDYPVPGDPGSWASEAAATPTLRLYQNVASGVPGVYLACECRVIEYNPSEFTKNLNRFAVYMDGEERPVAIQTSPWVDLANSTVLTPEEAAENASESLQDRGHDVEALHLETIDLVFSEPTLLYDFALEGSNSGLERASVSAHDATIRALGGQQTPGDTEPDDSDAPSPGPGGVLVLLAVAMAAAAYDHRRTED